MKNAGNAHFWQVDHEVKNIFKAKGVIILPSPQAWEKFSFIRKFFESEPREGYFIWIKKQIDFPLATCITMVSPRISQNLTNLLIIEKGIKARANVVCNAQTNNLGCKHLARGKLVLKPEAYLEYNHSHKWGEKDFVNPDYEFILQKNSHLTYTYKNLSPPENLIINTTFHNYAHSSSNLNFIINSIKHSKAKLKDVVFLEGQNSRATVRLRLVGREKSQIRAQSSILAKAPAQGHLDCQGLIVNKNSKISLIPELICQNPAAQITHEASIGKIAQEELNYLRMRGLTEKEAIDLMLSGFLKS